MPAAANEVAGNLSDVSSRLASQVPKEPRQSKVGQLGLIGALEWRLREFSGATELKCDSVIDLAPDFALPDDTLAETVSGIAQEVLQRAARHAGATALRIRIRLVPGLMQMDVTDNGVGATQENSADTPARGVMGMREHARQCGGSLHIVNVPGGGTHVCLRLPLGRHRKLSACDALFQS